MTEQDASATPQPDQRNVMAALIFSEEGVVNYEEALDAADKLIAAGFGNIEAAAPALKHEAVLEAAEIFVVENDDDGVSDFVARQMLTDYADNKYGRHD